jgi:hypothetical protein
MNITRDDCIALCGLEEDEVEAIAEHEHLPDVAAAALAQYLLGERVYEEGEVPVKAIQARFGLSRRKLRQACLAGGWRLRPQIAKPGPRQGQRPKTAKPGPRQGERRHDPKSLTRRLLRAAGERLARLEEATAAGGAAANPTAEELKAMAELARALPALMREDGLLGGAGSAERRAAERAEAAERAREEAERARQEEIREADEAFMRAELKRRYDILADNYEWYRQRGRGEEFLADLREAEERREAANEAWAEEGRRWVDAERSSQA